ncbi:MAG TPA: prepilin-type N-terminal cleavage/methylation domain-containing protein [Lacunisphaera sp.]|nr:prepilin-type N-terminal cleavage/methylation domain-containing protein [Lacunisphaera sp.]
MAPSSYPAPTLREGDSPPLAGNFPATLRLRSFLRRCTRAVTLVEVMVSMTLMATVLLAFIGTFIQSRRTTEASVLQAAATSLIYGIIEQIKQADYSTMLPNTDTDPNAIAPDGVTAVSPPYIRVRINQNKIVWLRVVYTPVTDEDSSTTTIPSPQGPSTTPAATAVASDVGAIDNFIGDIPLSTVTGTRSQNINLNIWVWVDGIPYSDHDVNDCKKVTIVYTYSFLDGRTTRTVRDREVFLRSPYDE